MQFYFNETVFNYDDLKVSVFTPFVVRVRDGIRVDRIINITHAHNLHEKRLDFGPFTRKFSQTILRNPLGFTKSAIKLCFMQRQV